MPDRKEMRLRHFENDTSLRFISDEDRHLFKHSPPRYRFNIIGTGTIGQEHMRVASLLGEASIHGIYDRQAKSMEVAADGWSKLTPRPLTLYDSLEAACLDPDIDALFICTPNHTHLEILETAIKSRKAIYLEKPMATTLEDARRIAELAKGYPAPFQIGLQYRFKSIYAEAFSELNDRKTVGAVKTLSMCEHRPPFLDKVGQWNKFARRSGGTLVEKCCHYFDLMNRLAQARPTRVFASGSRAVNFINFERGGERADILDNAFVIVDYENGIKGQFSLNMFAPAFYEELTVIGDDGKLVASEHVNTFRGAKLTSSVHIEKSEDGLTRDIEPGYADFIEKSGHSGGTYFAHKAFVEKLDGNDASGATVSEGLWAMIVGVAAEQSVKTGDAIHIKDLINAHDLDAFLGPEV